MRNLKLTYLRERVRSHTAGDWVVTWNSNTDCLVQGPGSVSPGAHQKVGFVLVLFVFPGASRGLSHSRCLLFNYFCMHLKCLQALAR